MAFLILCSHGVINEYAGTDFLALNYVFLVRCLHMSRNTHMAKIMSKSQRTPIPTYLIIKAVAYISTSCQFCYFYKKIDWPSTMESGLKKSNKLKCINDLVL